MTKRRSKKILKANFVKHSVSDIVNIKTFWALSIFLTISLIGVLIFQTQLLAEVSESISESQKELAGFSETDNENMHLLSSEEISILGELAQNLNFEKIDKVYYINAIESTVLAEQ